MSRRHWFLSIVAALMTAAVLATPALAGARRDLVVRDEVVLDGQPIPKGAYAIQWKATGDPGRFDVTVKRAGKVLGQATGKEILLAVPAANDSLVYEKGEDGSSNLVEIRFAGSKKAIEIGQSAVARGR